MRLFIFESHPVQYHAPVYRELHRLCVSHASGQVQVFYGTDATVRGHFDSGFGTAFAWDEPLLQGYPARVLNSENGVPLRGFNSLTGRGIPALLRRERPDAVVLTGLAYRFDWTVYFAALRLGIPIWLRTETQDEAFERGRVKAFLRYWFYRLAYAPVRKALVIGKLNAAHYERHGIASHRHLRSPYCVVDRFANLTEAQTANWRRQIRTEAGFDEHQTVLLFCGKLQAKKYPEALLEALAALPFEERRRYGVLYVGSGELETTVRLRARSLAGTRVWFAGFRNQTELPRFYVAADALVLPSRKMGETWGLVVNEALLAGLKVIVSRNVGCHADFHEAPGVSVFDGSVGDLKETLRRLSMNRLFGVPALAGPDRLKAGLQTSSWSQCTAQKTGRLSVNASGSPREFMRQYSIRSAAEGFAVAMGLDPAVLSVRDQADSGGRITSPPGSQGTALTREVVSN